MVFILYDNIFRGFLPTNFFPNQNQMNPQFFQSGFWNPTHNGILLNTEFQETLNQVNRVGNQDSCTDEQLSR